MIDYIEVYYNGTTTDRRSKLSKWDDYYRSLNLIQPNLEYFLK